MRKWRKKRTFRFSIASPEVLSLFRRCGTENMHALGRSGQVRSGRVPELRLIFCLPSRGCSSLLYDDYDWELLSLALWVETSE